jgi:hypothetical protein
MDTPEVIQLRAEVARLREEAARRIDEVREEKAYIMRTAIRKDIRKTEHIRGLENKLKRLKDSLTIMKESH